MFHPGKVVRIFSPRDSDVTTSDASAQATVRMWDENLLTLDVSAKLAGKLKENDVVLVDYRPRKVGGAAVPAHLIVKIIRGKRGEALMKDYESFRDKVRRDKEQKREEHNYIR
jgi:hypothetical protein